MPCRRSPNLVTDSDVGSDQPLWTEVFAQVEAERPRPLIIRMVRRSPYRNRKTMVPMAPNTPGSFHVTIGSQNIERTSIGTIVSSTA